MRPQTTLLGILVIDTNVRTGALRAEIEGHSHDTVLVGAMLRGIGEKGTVIGHIAVVLHALHIKDTSVVIKSDVQPRHVAFSAANNSEEVGPTDRRKIFKFPAALRCQGDKRAAFVVVVISNGDVPRSLDVRVRIVPCPHCPSRG